MASCFKVLNREQLRAEPWARSVRRQLFEHIPQLLPILQYFARVQLGQSNIEFFTVSALKSLKKPKPSYLAPPELHDPDNFALSCRHLQLEMILDWLNVVFGSGCNRNPCLRAIPT